MIEEVIDSFRNGLVSWLVALLLRLGANRCANALTRANSRFKCPVCRLVEVMRAKNLALTRCWATFCAAWRRWPDRIFQAIWKEVAGLLQVQIFQSQLAFISLGRTWLPHKIPIYLREMALLN